MIVRLKRLTIGKELDSQYPVRSGSIDSNLSLQKDADRSTIQGLGRGGPGSSRRSLLGEGQDQDARPRLDQYLPRELPAVVGDAPAGRVQPGQPGRVFAPALGLGGCASGL